MRTDAEEERDLMPLIAITGASSLRRETCDRSFGTLPRAPVPLSSLKRLLHGAVAPDESNRRKS